MSYDEDLAGQVRAAIGPEAGLSEKKMFGGLAFLIAGNMAVVVSHRGGIMIRVDPQTAEELLADPAVEQVERGGTPMRGLLFVSAEHLAGEEDAARWAGVAVAYARGLPAKG